MMKLFYMNISNSNYFSNYITNYAQFYVRIDTSKKARRNTMKKENRKLAQEKRAQERQKQEQQTKIKKFCMIGFPIAAVLLLIYLIAANPFESGSTTDDSSSANSNYTTEDTTTPTLQTDSSLIVEDGDTVNVDYVGSVDGVEFDGGNTQGYGADLTIGSGSYIDDFEDQLIGAHPGDTVNVVVTFPENYGAEELNGKEAVFVTTINGIYR